MSSEIPGAATYIQEARDILDGLEAMLLDLEANPDPESVDAVFRALHTLKGGGAMFGFRTLSGYVHHFEDAFDRVRDGKLHVSRALIDAGLRARDLLGTLLDLGGDGPEATERTTSSQGAALLADLVAVMEGGRDGSAPPRRDTKTWRISFRPDRRALLNGMRPDLLIEELVGLGSATVAVDARDVPDLEALDPQDSLLAWIVELQSDHPRSAIEAVFIFADDAETSIEQLQHDDSAAAAPKVGAAANGAVPAPSPPLPQTERDEAVAGEFRETASQTGRSRPRRNQGEASGESVRVAAGKLDEIMDQLGELVIANSRLQQAASNPEEGTLNALVEEMNRLVTVLRDGVLAIRMLPIETVLGKFRRVVRDLSEELGKDVRLETRGGETELDKNVLDRLSEPLVHMIRNSVDHGLEPAATRLALGKPAQGTLRLFARQEVGEVVISIEDDGAGLDASAIRSKAIERGLIPADANLPDSELHRLIFEPGFSTAKSVSAVSGRGVGMDAVLSAITALRGTIDVVSRAGLGTRVILRLPLTLAIIDGLLVRIAGSTYVIPLAAVEECVEFDSRELGRKSGRTLLQIRDALVPFLDLAGRLGGPDEAGVDRRVVVVRADGQRVGLVVDDVLGQNQAVVKALGPFHRDVRGFSGSTILGDGSVALIIDVSAIARDAARLRMTSHQRTAA